jgi:hypothetical protein
MKRLALIALLLVAGCERKQPAVDVAYNDTPSYGEAPASDATIVDAAPSDVALLPVDTRTPRAIVVNDTGPTRIIPIPPKPLLYDPESAKIKVFPTVVATPYPPGMLSFANEGDYIQTVLGGVQDTISRLQKYQEEITVAQNKQDYRKMSSLCASASALASSSRSRVAKYIPPTRYYNLHIAIIQYFRSYSVLMSHFSEGARNRDVLTFIGTSPHERELKAATRLLEDEIKRAKF